MSWPALCPRKQFLGNAATTLWEISAAAQVICAGRMLQND
jgi:hypothetical protein